MSKAEQALEMFSNDFNCAQAVFSVYSEDFGLSPKLACKTACAFGAGMGRTGRVCGAVTGAFMVIGLARGMAKAEWKEHIKEVQTRLKLEGNYEDIVERYRSNADNQPDTLTVQLKALKSTGFEEVDCFYKYGIFTIFGGKKLGS